MCLTICLHQITNQVNCFAISMTLNKYSVQQRKFVFCSKQKCSIRSVNKCKKEKEQSKRHKIYSLIYLKYQWMRINGTAQITSIFTIYTYSLNELMQNRFKDHVLHLSAWQMQRRKKTTEIIIYKYKKFSFCIANQKM